MKLHGYKLEEMNKIYHTLDRYKYMSKEAIESIYDENGLETNGCHPSIYWQNPYEVGFDEAKKKKGCMLFGRKLRIGDLIWMGNKDAFKEGMVIDIKHVPGDTLIEVESMGLCRHSFYASSGDSGGLICEADYKLYWEKPEKEIEYYLPTRNGGKKRVYVGDEVFVSSNSDIRKISKFDNNDIYIDNDSSYWFENNSGKYTQSNGVFYGDYTLYADKEQIYYLPDTKGNLCKVKEGDTCWVKWTNGISECTIADINPEQDTFMAKFVPPIDGCKNSDLYRFKTGILALYPLNWTCTVDRHQVIDFSKYAHFNEVGDEYKWFAVDSDGTAGYFIEKPHINEDGDWSILENIGDDGWLASHVIEELQYCIETEYKYSLVERK